MSVVLVASKLGAARETRRHARGCYKVRSTCVFAVRRAACALRVCVAWCENALTGEEQRLGVAGVETFMIYFATPPVKKKNSMDTFPCMKSYQHAPPSHRP